MVVLKADRPSNNPNLPVLNITEQEIKILKLNPTAWIEATSGVVSSGGEVSLVRDKTGKADWTTIASLKPRLVTSGNGVAFRFGRAASNSGCLLAQADYETYPDDGIYSKFILYRIPVPNTEGYASTGGNICGNYAAAGDWLRVRFGNDQFQTDGVWINHGGTEVSDPSNYPINTTIVGFRDYLWHTIAIEATPTYHRWEQDGVLLQQKDIPAKPFATAESRRHVIGGAGNPINNGFQGDIAAELIIPGVLSQDSKETIYERFNSMKAALTA
ncbi:hypothetical protein [Serratia proteamaculans]|uniref:Uncharacterized protein n=1 Tax=Serratia proteamaculans TaxID=28151 RepID=A0A5Q2VD04_SERPR|nr:hypothetical protein [Serratia proteamaculans]QGH63447.1 hypothetical protein GHV41_22510 [Serratia proteamaculans]